MEVNGPHKRGQQMELTVVHGPRRMETLEQSENTSLGTQAGGRKQVGAFGRGKSSTPTEPPREFFCSFNISSALNCGPGPKLVSG